MYWVCTGMHLVHTMLSWLYYTDFKVYCSQAVRVRNFYPNLVPKYELVRTFFPNMYLVHTFHLSMYLVCTKYTLHTGNKSTYLRLKVHTLELQVVWYVPVRNPFPKPIENVVLGAKWNVHIWNRLRDRYSRLYTGTLKSGCLQRSNIRELRISLKSSGCYMLLAHF